MKKYILIYFLCTNTITIAASSEITDSLIIQGQISGWTYFNKNNEYPLRSGLRYIPQANFKIKFSENKLLDFEASANLYGNYNTQLPVNGVTYPKKYFEGNLHLYRAWARYSTDQFELRVGLQKINFGSATMLRPLMWFDQIDPRDPLHLTNGVWGLLGRYYFPNNANLWLWSLYGNKETKTWEIAPTKEKTPEFGGRFQQPLPKGEAAISFHHRLADSRNLSSFIPENANISENRLGLDGKWDLGVGLWVEGAWINKNKNIGMFTNQEIFSAGMDYTFGIGNGLNIIGEHMVFSYDEKPFTFSGRTEFSALSLTYPIGLFSQINGIVYYDWTNNALYNFLSWNVQFNNLSFYLMGYHNPLLYQIPQQNGNANIFGGTGVQLMFVINH